jgi:hypothetical protein
MADCLTAGRQLVRLGLGSSAVRLAVPLVESSR